MKNWTIRQRILSSFFLILALTAAMGGLIFLFLRTIEKETIAVKTDSTPGVYLGNEILVNLLDGQLLTQRHVVELDRQAGFEAQIQANRSHNDTLLRKYEATIFKTRDRELFQAVKAAYEPFKQSQERVLKLVREQQRAAAVELLARELEPRFATLHAALQQLLEFNQAGNDASLLEINKTIVRARIIIAVALFVAVLVSVLAGRSLFGAVNQPLARLVAALNVMRQGDFTERLQLDRRDEFGTVGDGFNRMLDELAALVGQIQKSSLRVNTSVTEISATAKEQQATAREIAATTEEIGATSMEISSTSQDLVRTMDRVVAVAEQSAALAGSGQTGLASMEETMHRVMDASGSISAKLALLSEKAGNINQVIITITKVADQTNLLSLNAAIEAEKAGEHGRGFGVVATEIRRLADQTAVATYDIEQTVKEIQSAVSASVMGMDKFSEEVRRGIQAVQQIGGQLSEIIQQVQTLAPRFEEVHEGMQAQATGAEQITQALTQLNEAVQQTVESLQQSTTAIDELNEVANGLRGGVSRFKLLPA
jgi:methyl-accepting chemotaxis protein WspA